MSFFDLFIISGSPVSDAIETECVATVFKDAKSLTVSKYLFEANNAFLVSFVANLTVLTNDLLGSTLAKLVNRSHTRWVHIFAACVISTSTFEEPFANDPIFVVLQEVINYFIILITFIFWLLILLSDTNFHNLTQLFAIGCQIDGLSLLALQQLFIIFALLCFLILQLLCEILQDIKILLTKLLLNIWIE